MTDSRLPGRGLRADHPRAGADDAGGGHRLSPRLPESEYDDPLGKSTGAAGHLRRHRRRDGSGAPHRLRGGDRQDAAAASTSRRSAAWKASRKPPIQVGDIRTLKVAVAHGLGNARAAARGGPRGRRPTTTSSRSWPVPAAASAAAASRSRSATRSARPASGAIYHGDADMPLRKSHENPVGSGALRGVPGQAAGRTSRTSCCTRTTRRGTAKPSVQRRSLRRLLRRWVRQRSDEPGQMAAFR